MASSLVLKASFNTGTSADSAVVRLATSSDWTQVHEALSAALERTTGSTGEFSVMYKDDDADAIVINSQDCLDEAIRVVGSPLRLHIRVATATEAPKASAAASRTRRHQLDGAYIPPHLRVGEPALKAPASEDADASGRGRRHRGAKVGRRNITIVKHIGGSDPIQANPSETVEKSWRIRNDDATKSTPDGARLVLVSKHTLIRLVASDPIKALAPGEEVDVACRLLAPEKAGEYSAFLRMAHPESGRLGPRLSVGIAVVASSSACSSSDDLAGAAAKGARSHGRKHRFVREDVPALSETDIAELERIADSLKLPPVFVEHVMCDVAPNFRNGFEAAATAIRCVAELHAKGVEDIQMARMLRAPQWEKKIQRCHARMLKREERAVKRANRARGAAAAAAEFSSDEDAAVDSDGEAAEAEVDDADEAEVGDADADIDAEEDDADAPSSEPLVTRASLGADVGAKRAAVREAKSEQDAATADVKAAKKMLAAARSALDSATAAKRRASRKLTKARNELAVARGRIAGFKAATAAKSE